MSVTESKKIFDVSTEVKNSGWYDSFFNYPIFNESYANSSSDLLKLEYLSSEERQIVFDTMIKYKSANIVNQYAIFNDYSKILMSDYNVPKRSIPNTYFNLDYKRYILYMFYNNLIGDIVYNFNSKDDNIDISFRKTVNKLISMHPEKFYKISSVFNLHKNKDKILNIKHHFIVCDNFKDKDSDNKLFIDYDDEDDENKQIIDNMNINEIVRNYDNDVYYELTSILYATAYNEKNNENKPPKTSYICIFRYKFNLWLVNSDGVYIIDNVKDFTYGYYPKYLVYNRLYDKSKMS